MTFEEQHFYYFNNVGRVMEWSLYTLAENFKPANCKLSPWCLSGGLRQFQFIVHLLTFSILLIYCQINIYICTLLFYN